MNQGLFFPHNQMSRHLEFSARFFTDHSWLIDRNGIYDAIMPIFSISGFILLPTQSQPEVIFIKKFI